MKLEKVILNTSGDGWWSNTQKSVTITDIKIDYIDDDFGGTNKDKSPRYGTVNVFFDTKTWNPDEDGLIYTDKQFLKELRGFLDKHGLPGKDVDYTEQGMQGDDYVSMSVGKSFLNAWGEKFDIDWAVQAKEQQAEFDRKMMKMLEKRKGNKNKM